MADLRAVDAADAAEQARQEAWAERVHGHVQREWGKAMLTLGILSFAVGGLTWVLLGITFEGATATAAAVTIAWALPHRVAALVRAQRLEDLLK